MPVLFSILLSIVVSLSCVQASECKTEPSQEPEFDSYEFRQKVGGQLTEMIQAEIARAKDTATVLLEMKKRVLKGEDLGEDSDIYAGFISGVDKKSCVVSELQGSVLSILSSIRVMTRRIQLFSRYAQGNDEEWRKEKQAFKITEDAGRSGSLLHYLLWDILDSLSARTASLMKGEGCGASNLPGYEAYYYTGRIQGELLDSLYLLRLNKFKFLYDMTPHDQLSDKVIGTLRCTPFCSSYLRGDNLRAPTANRGIVDWVVFGFCQKNKAFPEKLDELGHQKTAEDFWKLFSAREYEGCSEKLLSVVKEIYKGTKHSFDVRALPIRSKTKINKLLMLLLPVSKKAAVHLLKDDWLVERKKSDKTKRSKKSKSVQVVELTPETQAEIERLRTTLKKRKGKRGKALKKIKGHNKRVTEKIRAYETGEKIFILQEVDTVEQDVPAVEETEKPAIPPKKVHPSSVSTSGASVRSSSTYGMKPLFQEEREFNPIRAAELLWEHERVPFRDLETVMKRFKEQGLGMMRSRGTSHHVLSLVDGEGQRHTATVARPHKFTKDRFGAAAIKDLSDLFRRAGYALPLDQGDEKTRQ